VTITETKIAGCFLLEPKIFRDERGVFFESYNRQEFEKQIGRPIRFVQDNHSISQKGVLRGLHFQKGEYAQAKLVRVIRGEVLDVIIDIRKESATFGSHIKMRLSEQNRKMLFIPKGLAHGFLSLTQDATFVYKCDNYYNKNAEGGIIYNDTELSIDWEYPEDQLLLSDKDKKLPGFKDLQL
jgi:dTDP-4-dehydrorhamnose 3,5-epimerase